MLTADASHSRPIDGPVPSPCINVCRIEPAGGLCEGCWRTLDEIAVWSQLPDPAKLAVWAQLEQRRAARVSDAGVAGVAGAVGPGAADPGAEVTNSGRNEVQP